MGRVGMLCSKVAVFKVIKIKYSVSLVQWVFLGIKRVAHSGEDGICFEFIDGRWDSKASQIMKMKNINLVKDNSDPYEERIFHLVNISG